MGRQKREPRTLQEAIIYFAEPENCRNYVAARRWKDGVVVCPTCGRDDVGYLEKQAKWQCKSRHAKRQFSIKVGTIFEGSPIRLDKWLCAVWMLTNCKNGVSSYEIARDIGVTQKTAWFMLQRIRLAMQDQDDGGKLGGEVEVDETYIGGKARNMHMKKRLRSVRGTGGIDKVAVLGLLERGESKRKSRIRTKIINTVSACELQSRVREEVESGSTVYSDQLRGYQGLRHDYIHEFVNHAEEYVRDNVHTNGIENFWSLLKRGIGGTYVSVEPFHLFRYLDEQSFRFNNRDDDDSGRFSDVVSQIANKRLTYEQLTGKQATTTSYYTTH